MTNGERLFELDCLAPQAEFELCLTACVPKRKSLSFCLAPDKGKTNVGVRQICSENVSFRHLTELGGHHLSNEGDVACRKHLKRFMARYYARRNERERILEPELPIFQGFPNVVTPLALCSNNGRLTRSCGWTSCHSKLEMGEQQKLACETPQK